MDSPSTATASSPSTAGGSSPADGSESSPYAQTGRSPLILHVSFNQEKNCFAVGIDQGFQIYQCEPLLKIIDRRFHSTEFGRTREAGFSIVEMHYASNLVAMVGNGSSWQYPPDTVYISDEAGPAQFRVLRFKSNVLAVRLSTNKIVVVLDDGVYLSNLFVAGNPYVINTGSNPHGAIAVSQAACPFVLICPGDDVGSVKIYEANTGEIKKVQAHTSRIRCLSTTQDGTFFATASVKGTIVRIFSKEGFPLRKLRRGFDTSTINSMAFSSDFHWLVAASSGRTIHVYNLGDLSAPINDVNESHSQGVLSKFKLLFTGELAGEIIGERSSARYPLPLDEFVVEFGLANSIMVAVKSGRFLTCLFDPVNRGGMYLVDTKVLRLA